MVPVLLRQSPKMAQPSQTARYSRAFTLIEVMLAVAIVILFSTSIFPNLWSSREKTRDAIRVNDLKSLAQVVETYFAEHHEFPPTSQDKKVPRAELAEYYPPGVFPEDQQPAGYGYFYERLTDPNGYCLGVMLEHLPQEGDDLCGSFEVNYKIKGP